VRRSWGRIDDTATYSYANGLVLLCIRRRALTFTLALSRKAADSGGTSLGPKNESERTSP
jgi:hypothetical protein